MRLAAVVLALLGFFAGACAQPPASPTAAQNLALCQPPSNDPNAVSLHALVDRADVIVLATVVRVEEPPAAAPGVARDMPLLVGVGQRLTLRAIETVKGTVSSEFSVHDGPCP